MNILIADDEDIVLRTLSDYLRDSGHNVETACTGREALGLAASRSYDMALIDVRMPGMDGLSVLERLGHARPELGVVIITGHGNMEVAVQALRLGAVDFLTKPVKFLELDAVLEKAGRLQTLRTGERRLRDTIAGIQAAGDRRDRARSFVGVSSATERVKDDIRRAVEARCDTIMITGETGTGKEVVAREIHFQADAPDSPFIAVSCPALPDSLVESELFGHMKGAFTGATEDRAGCFELANGGTLFLDEVADLSAMAQASLLRVLETRMVRRVGGAREMPVTVRVVTATNTPLEQLVGDGKFRRDLYYRLNVFAISLLPLRQRPEDILPLAYHFLTLHCRTRGVERGSFSEEAEQLLQDYQFPGNARELRNVVERAAILCRQGPIRGEHLALTRTTAVPNGPLPTERAGASERDRILAALEQHRWNRRQAAEALRMPYSTLRYKIQRFGLQ